MGIFKGFLGCFSENARFEDVAHAVWFFYYRFQGKVP